MAKKLEMTLNFDDPTVGETTEHQRMAEGIEFEDRCSELIRMRRREVYIQFLNEVESLRISFKKGENADLKRTVLIKYFPVRYQRQGIDEYSSEKLNEAFLGFVNYSRGLVRKASNK